MDGRSIVRDSAAGEVAARFGDVRGVSKNIGIIRAMEAKLGTPVLVPEEPQTVGALGAALFAFDRAMKEAIE